MMGGNIQTYVPNWDKKKKAFLNLSKEGEIGWRSDGNKWLKMGERLYIILYVDNIRYKWLEISSSNEKLW